ncbi:MAG: glycosyltransferase family 39 protein [Planctomycetota bacterium]
MNPLPPRDRLGRDRLIIVLVGLATLLPGLGQLADLASREGRHALIAAEMAASGDLVVPRLLGEEYRDKPPVLHAAAAGLYRLTGRPSLGAARAVTALAALIGALLLHALARATGRDRRVALWAALALLGAFGYARMARVARPDMILGAAILAATWALVRAGGATSGPRRALWIFLGGAMVGLGVLTKGPWGLVFPLVAVLAVRFERGPRATTDASSPVARAVSDLAAFLPGLLLAVAVWVLPAYLRDDGAYLERVIFQPNLVSGSSHHARSFFFYFGNGPLFLLPLTLFAPLLLLAPRRRSWALLAAGVIFLLLSLVPGKRSHYLVPWYPFAVLAVVEAVFRHDHRRLARRAFFGLVGLSLLVMPLANTLGPIRKGRTLEPDLVASREIIRELGADASLVCVSDLGEKVGLAARLDGEAIAPRVHEVGDLDRLATFLEARRRPASGWAVLVPDRMRAEFERRWPEARPLRTGFGERTRLGLWRLPGA